MSPCPDNHHIAKRIKTPSSASVFVYIQTNNDIGTVELLLINIIVYFPICFVCVFHLFYNKRISFLGGFSLVNLHFRTKWVCAMCGSSSSHLSHTV